MIQEVILKYAWQLTKVMVPNSIFWIVCTLQDDDLVNVVSKLPFCYYLSYLSSY